MDVQLEIIKRLNAIQAELDFLRSLDAGSGSGGVTTATLPLAITGTNIAIAGTVTNDGGFVVKQTGAASVQTGTAYLAQAVNTPTLKIDNTSVANASTADGISATASSTNAASAAGRFAHSGSGMGLVCSSAAQSGIQSTTSGNAPGLLVSATSAGANANGYGIQASTNSTSATASAGIFTNNGSGDGAQGTTANNAAFGIKGTNTAGTDGAGAGGKFDGGTHTIGTIITTTHATKEALQVIQSSTGPVFTGYSGATQTSQINTDGSANIYVAPNYVMNGDMLVNQRFGPAGTVAIATGTQKQYMVDRWYLDKDGTSQGTLSQQVFTVGQTDVPDEPTYYLDWNHSTAGTGATKDNIQHNIESVRTLAGKQVTLSFYGKVAASTQTITPEIEQNFGSGGSPSAAVVNTSSGKTFTTTFQKFTYTVTLASISGKTIGTTLNSDSLVIRFKCPLNTACQISIAHVQLELGPIATPYRVQSNGEVMNACQRFYQKSFDYPQAVVTNAGTNVGAFRFQQILGAAASIIGPLAFFRTPIVKIPTVTLYNLSVANNQIRNGSINADCTASTAASISNSSFTVSATTAGGSAVGNINSVHWDANADY